MSGREVLGVDEGLLLVRHSGLLNASLGLRATVLTALISIATWVSSTVLVATTTEVAALTTSTLMEVLTSSVLVIVLSLVIVVLVVHALAAVVSTLTTTEHAASHLVGVCTFSLVTHVFTVAVPVKELVLLLCEPFILQFLL